MPLYPCTRVVRWCWGLTSRHHAYLVSTLLSISSPLFMRQSDKDRETERETGGERDRDLSSALCGLACLVLSAAYTRRAGPWTSRHSFSCLDLWLCLRNTGGREGRKGREDYWHVCWVGRGGRIIDMFATIPCGIWWFEVRPSYLVWHMFYTLTILLGFVSTWHRLESCERRKLQVRRCLHKTQAVGKLAFLIDTWCRRALREGLPHCGCHPWAISGLVVM